MFLIASSSENTKLKLALGYITPSFASGIVVNHS